MTQEDNGAIRSIWDGLNALQNAEEEPRKKIIDSIKSRLEELATYIKDKDDEIKKWKVNFETTKTALNAERQVSKTLTNLIKDIMRDNE